MAREILGRMRCPECGHPGAVIKRQKNGLLYRFCGDGCEAQFFARRPEQEAAMRAALAAATGTGTEAQTAQPEPKPESKLETKPAPSQKPAGFSLRGLA